ncbi:putative Serine/threonine-protein phosphatase 6 catalytic subunit [Paratrimastix pyriformis]|uniref:Serine/threonine-protein phosphatase 6 catalytic subunit n=1 Tax=Paratrimastix pyriformis TaxID=342808 RepID=A0ABQ8UCC3_9EUKA|nr:putative Serine/threonine-protein phosphatase 6 catalytic subunit [Paratrimastix pyriformis]
MSHAHGNCLEKAQTCPKCGRAIDANLSEMVERALMPFSPPVLLTPPPGSPAATDGTFTVTFLTGEEITLKYNPALPIRELRELIHQQQPDYPPAKQKLFWGPNELVDGTLGTAGVVPGATIQMILAMYAIKRGDSLNHVTFDLHWGYPPSGQDYLDASCLIFDAAGGNRDFKWADYSKRDECAGAVHHSGDKMTSSSGCHTIEIDLRQLPPEAHFLFFTLSAYNCRDISQFHQPAVNLFETRNPGQPLTEYCIRHAGRSEAVVMCGLCRAGDGWVVQAIGTQCAGTVRDYSDMIRVCQETLRRPGWRPS